VKVDDYEDEPVVAPRFKRDAVRVATIDDVSGIVAIELSGISPHLRATRADDIAKAKRKRYAHWKSAIDGPAAGDFAKVWVADEGGAVLGFAHCDISPNPPRVAQVIELRVQDFHEERNVQRLLVKKALSLARRHGCEELSVVAGDAGRPEGAAICEMLRRYGFRPVYEGPVARANAVMQRGSLYVRTVETRARE
jgi:GNAT superfamily N-acetyltransferase